MNLFLKAAPTLALALFWGFTLSQAEAQTFGIPELVSKDATGVLVYHQEIMIPVSSSDSEAKKQEKIQSALTTGKGQVVALAITRVRIETDQLTSETKSGRKSKHNESFRENVSTVSDANVQTEITNDVLAGGYLVLNVKYVVDPNKKALEESSALAENLKKNFHVTKRLHDGTTFISIGFPYHVEGSDYYHSFCISKAQEKSKKFMKKMCTVLGFTDLVDHESSVEIPAKINYLGKKIEWYEYLDGLRTTAMQQMHVCVDLWTQLDPVDFDIRDLRIDQPYHRHIKAGEYKLSQLVCK